ncbi:hypothetical protein ANOM_009037 [Aspergillus nomiae NRRL 13137]|uniref:Uncharacterized protein n=1 Tax=Aspergillus nomiae NRRL (strain ATCC 15546 / NRRL 13137 / CBS 260.88 / M93) TaxID=1509407 RepID=A0A0L1IV44_ASPN3|nr:uncharacterized protein ANOM_009037 [Aspergillus nomiae NRRL 13137]KNG83364.1 hypothetical protein ANOM_009037 [Aspergillus nomiae NRRL 13137]
MGPNHKVIASLSTLPRELAHQILNDIRIWDILRLICHNNAQINTDILTHPTLGRLFHHDTGVLDEVRAAADLYRTVCAAHSLTAAPLTSPLALNAQTFKSDYKEITNYMRHRLIDELYLDSWKVDVLSRYAPLPTVWETGTIAGLEAGWNTIQDAQEKVNKRKAVQLHKAADLLEANPDVLKKMVDPSQTPRKNIPHIVERIRGAEKRVARQSLLWGHTLTGTSWFMYGHFSLVPFDRTWVLFCRDWRAWGWSTESLGEVGVSVRVVVEGLRFVYSGEEEGRLPRIAMHEDSRSWYFIPRGPVDALNYAMDGWARQYDAHDEREIAWLEAFVAVYRHFENQRRDS